MPSFVVLMTLAILPISVSIPVLVMSTLPLPYTTSLPRYTIFFLSPNGISSCAITSIFFFTLVLSPVNADSSTVKEAHSMILPSALIESPASSKTTSPFTSCVDGSTTTFWSRSTLLVEALIFCNASMAFSALLSCRTPKTALIKTTIRIIKLSVGKNAFCSKEHS